MHSGQSLYLVNPAPDFPGYFGGEVYAAGGFAQAVRIADLAIPTLAALAPAGFAVSLCDESVAPVDLDAPAAFVGLTGKVTQVQRMKALAAEFRRRGKVVLMGGPYASLSPAALRPHCDILVRGEVEDIAPALFADLAAGRWQDEYVGGRPDLARCPPPRWDLYPNQRALLGNVQTSRGCPFECEFCDVIQYLGRKQRHKPVAAVLQELDTLYDLDYRKVFLSDDNFTVFPGRARELLAALRDWNSQRARGRMSFITQASIEASADEQLVRLSAAAGLDHWFIGIETPSEQSLRESRKRQSVGVDQAQRVRRLAELGVSVTGGMIVGFDADGPDIFQRQLEFAMATPIPIFTVGALNAPPTTPLYDRLAREGRLIEACGDDPGAALPWQTNVRPLLLSREELFNGLKWLCNKLYEPANFGRRVLDLIACLPQPEELPPRRRPSARQIDTDTLDLLARLPRLGTAEATMCAAIFQAAAARPWVSDHVMSALLQYAQLRHMYALGGFWQPEPALR